MAMQSVVIRIHATEDNAIDWTVDQPEQLAFDDVLSAIHQIVQDDTAQAFEYEDEEGDRITVRGDDELQAMISFYLSFYGIINESTPPLEIFAKDVKSGKRNVEDLKIMCSDNGEEMDTGSGKRQAANVPQVQYSPMDSVSPGTKKMSGDVRKILEGGAIQDFDLTDLVLLGSGQCGTVYKARHAPTGMVMALKSILLTIDASKQSQIIAELEVLHRCKSSSIICFYGAFFTEGKISICTEYMDGGSLDKYGVIPEPILGQIAVSIVKGLQYLWTLKVMHRDLKPSNILVNTQGRVKLCDFGVSVQLIDSIAKTYIGTSAYMAPERLMGDTYRMRAEVWSLGVLLFELVSGCFPYKSAHNSSSPVELINSIVAKDPPRLPPHPYSPGIVDFISKCMTKDPTGRPEPQYLMHHPFIQKYVDRDDSTIAAWVKQSMALKRSA